ncbi:MAG TPA: IS1 family transposase [Candidatus Angelobacter sp.]|nr:IS1 family transposase [Candidatus Angelobacter sp.]
MNRLDINKRAQVLKALVEGASIRATVRMTGVAKNTVTKLLVDLGRACTSFHDKNVRNVSSRRVQCDEIWCFCYAKEKNVTPEQKAKGAGDVWTWVAIDADIKLVLSYLCASRDAASAYDFMEDLASRVTTRIQITTDGHRAYAEAVEGAFGMDVDYAMLIKLYGAPSEKYDTRYSPSEMVSTRTAVLSGTPDVRHISTSFVERQNLTMRMQMRRFTRLTNGFSKKRANLEAAVAVHYVFYNFCRIHQSLRVTPAMEAGLTDHVWSVEELISLLENSN